MKVIKIYLEKINNDNRWTHLKKKILIVDNDNGLQNLLCRFFTYNDYKTQAASDGRNARKIFREFQPDLVTIDVNLPDESGFNVCQ